MKSGHRSPRPASEPRAVGGASRPGRETARLIVNAARAVLMNEGYAQFSMRNVAAQAGIHLSNVQYYFRTRDDLVRALMEDTNERYLTAYTQCLAKAPPDRMKRFEAVLDFILQDIADSATRRYFTQMWALLDSLDAGSGQLLDEFYAMDIAALSERVAEVNPNCPAADVRRRASLLAALIEGLLIVRGAHSSSAAEMKRLTKSAKRVGIQIALGEMTSDEID